MRQQIPYRRMRRPTLRHMFGIKTNEGFATVLAGHSQWEDTVYSCEEIEGLSIMPCGTKPANPAELITSPRVKQLINEMREKYDFVVIDSPPVLAVTDPSAVAAQVDGVLLVLRVRRGVQIAATRAREMLADVDANVLGVIVNAVDKKSGYGRYGNGYGYGYGYTTEGENEDSPIKPTREPKRLTLEAGHH